MKEEKLNKLSKKIGCGLDITPNRAVAIEPTFCGDGMLCDICKAELKCHSEVNKQ